MDREDRDPTLEFRLAVHDANQMLTVIEGRTGLLLGRAAGKDREHLLAVRQACRDAAEILARVHHVDDPAQAGSTLLAEAVVATLALVRPGAGRQEWCDPEAARAPGRWSCRSEIPAGAVVAVPAQILREVLANLLTNALEAMPHGGRIEITASLDGGLAVLRVRDSGPGIPADLVREIFDVGGSTKGGPGRGLGLAGSRALLGRFGAGLAYEVPAEGGACFRLELPLAAVSAAAAAVGGGTEPDAGAGIQEPGRTARILVVDDEDSVRDMLAEVLGELGFGVTVVADPASALAGFQKGAFQIALLDQTLPGMSGQELAKKLRASDPCLTVFLMTGWGNEQALAAPDPATVDFTACKPMEFDRLRGLLQEAVDLHARRRADGSREDG